MPHSREDDRRPEFIAATGRAFFAERVEVAIDVWSIRSDEVTAGQPLEQQVQAGHTLLAYTQERGGPVRVTLMHYAIGDGGIIEWRDTESGEPGSNDPYAAAVRAATSDPELRQMIESIAQDMRIDPVEARARYLSTAMQTIGPLFPGGIVELTFGHDEAELADATRQSLDVTMGRPNAEWN